MATVKFAEGYRLPTYPFLEPPELRGGKPGHYPVVIVGAGLSGLTLACDLALRGIPAVVLDEDDSVGVRGASSRGIVYAQKSLEIFARLGIYERIHGKGVSWSVGKTFAGDDLVYGFNRQTENASRQPPFINLQQFYIEWFLVERIQELGRSDLRWKSKVVGVEQGAEAVRVTVETSTGSYRLEAEWLIDASGANSTIRDGFGLDAHQALGVDRWCITDVRFKKALPAERWTWVEAPFNDNRAVWQHPMADDVWRIDYQMDADADPRYVSRPEVAAERLRAHLGPTVDFEFVWIGPYAYRDLLLDDFRHGRVFFIGDAAHVVCPFGARGGNNGIQDAANLAWKLALVLAGKAPPRLLDSYSAERRAAAVENLRVTSRTTRFLAPRSPAERILRNAVLDLARRHEFARPLVNTGRMCVANDYPPSPCLPQGGVSVQNAPLCLPDGRPGGLMDLLADGTALIGVWFAPTDASVGEVAGLLRKPLPFALYACGNAPGLPCIEDVEGKLAAHLRVAPGAFFLIRPDAYLAARLDNPRTAEVETAIQQALGHV